MGGGTEQGPQLEIEAGEGELNVYTRLEQGGESERIREVRYNDAGQKLLLAS